jgi:CheY-like chemotaxis protein
MSDFKILVVDDSPTIVAMLTQILKSNGYDVRSAGDGEEALDVVEEFTPDLIFLDYQMPNMNGLETCRELKKDPELQDVPVVILTGEASPQMKMHFLEVGVDDYLNKPVNPKELLQAVKEIIRLRS